MTDRIRSPRTWGAHPIGDGQARFRLWAPGQQQVALAVTATDATVAMEATGEGWFELVTDAVAVGEGYAFALDDGLRVPDPAARAQVGSVHGPSMLVDPLRYAWSCVDWRGRPWHEAVIYELHTGTFSPEGTFEGVSRRLDHLASVGVTAIELMPLAQFSGQRGWGYDGVLTYAPHNAYGRPDDLRRLVDAAHAREIMVLLDVVYNHFGPDGNYLHTYAPQFFNESRHTPWGAAIDYRHRAVRAFAIENALHWLEEYRIDGLRLDAIDQIDDPSQTHVLEELARAVRARFPDRHVHLTTEDERNGTSLHVRKESGAPIFYTAEWNDDFHHAAHVAATGEAEGYYADYDAPVTRLSRALAEGFVYQGEPSRAWGGEPRGAPSGHQPPDAFVDFIQNHDQIGNRAFGERLTTLAPPHVVEALTGILLLAPQVPLVFMGEEWGETRPFLFFTDFSGALADAVREGRRREFAGWSSFDDVERRQLIPDPNAVQTFEDSRLDWADAAQSDASRRMALFKRLLAFRARHLMPRLAGVEGRAALCHGAVGKLLHVSWRLGDGSVLRLWANLGDAQQRLPTWMSPGSTASTVDGEMVDACQIAIPDRAGSLLDSGTLDGWSVVVRVDTNATEGRSTDDEADAFDRLAAAHGIASSYEMEGGRLVEVGAETKRALLSALGVDACNGSSVSQGNVQSQGVPIAQACVPSPDCHLPSWLDKGRCWGVTCQLYGLRSGRNAGIGDFADLLAVGAFAASRGADFIGVSPLHALFPGDPSRCSPYAPSSRRFLNPLYIAVDWLSGWSDRCKAEIAKPDDGPLVDYSQVGRRKLAALQEAYGAFSAVHAASGSQEALAYEQFVEERGTTLQRFSCFEAIAEAMSVAYGSTGAGWTSWPSELQDVAGPAAASFAEANADRVRFHMWLQWVADRQLRDVQRRLRAHGMRIGLYLDLAVGVAPDGAETWMSPGATLTEVEIGAPPDLFNPQGQSWGLAPISPRLLASGQTDLFRDLATQCMRAAGAVRLDHVMALERLYLIPRGASAREGGYVAYPLERLLMELSGVSHATSTIVIGEDLGTVRPAFRERMRAAQIQSYRVLMFEREPDGAFRSCGDWPHEAIAVASTHDLPTVRGWWQGGDIDLRALIGTIAAGDVASAHDERRRDRAMLVGMLAAQCLLGGSASGRRDVKPSTVTAEAIAVAVHRHLARTPCRMMAVQLEDLVGSEAQANVPGTVSEHPNWRRRSPVAVEDLPRHTLANAIVDAIAQERPRRHAAAIPAATYRLQLREGMTFDRAAGLVPYLARLGVSHLYVSPILQAAPQSLHGYDVVDPTRLDAALGGETGFAALSDASKACCIGLIVDIVPNHMAASAHAPWFRDVLTWGRDSAAARHFDIDWSAPRLLLPVLGDGYGRLLADGAFRLAFDEDTGTVSWAYGRQRLPLTPPSYALVLDRIADSGLAAIARRFAAAVPDDTRELAAASKLAFASPCRRRALDAALRSIADDREAMDALHDRQVWQLAHWRVARDMLTHRRFFEISELIGVKVESGQTFDAVHEKILQLVEDGRIDGLRVDHIDGLALPTAYLARLDAALARRRQVPIYVEKILEPGEALRPDWPVAGTTGYEVIAALAGLLVDPGGEADLTTAYEAFTGEPYRYDAAVIAAKRQIISWNLAAELSGLVRAARRIADEDRCARDIGTDTLARAIAELAAAMPVYRTYIDTDGVSATDRETLDKAFAGAVAGSDLEDRRAFDFLATLFELDGGVMTSVRERLRFTLMFQQFTGPVMAKALEDTVFYRLNRLIGLNEVGGSPDLFGAPVGQFHDAMRARAEAMPAGLSATATHDTKRGEDARARLYAISETAAAWGQAANRWSRLNARLRGATERGPAPEPRMEWLFYQSLLGAWPADLEPNDREGMARLAQRMTAFMEKAAREAKQQTRWTRPAADYESGLSSFVTAALDADCSAAFLSDFLAFCEPLMRAGAVNSLSQTLVKLTAPGVPDIYQGTERWDLSLVDPDNRRPVDWDGLDAPDITLAGDDIAGAVGAWTDGRIKQHVLAAGLGYRRRQRRLYAAGNYLPLEVAGPAGDQLAAFARVAVASDEPGVDATTDHDAVAVTVVARRALALMDRDGGLRLDHASLVGTHIRLPDARAVQWQNLQWEDVLTGRTVTPWDRGIACEDAFSILPVALLRARRAAPGEDAKS